MSYATRDRCRLYYEVGGTPGAPRLVLIRGFARSGRYWGPLLPALAPAFELLVLDNRGVGHSDATRPPYSTDLHADDVAAVMDDAGWSRAHVFGMSLGGMIAQKVALRHGDRVDRLVLGCTTPGGRRARRFPWSSVATLGRSALAGGDRGVDLVLPLLVSEACLREHPEVRELWQRLAREEPRSTAGTLGQLAAASRHNAHAALPTIAARTLVITGDDDPLVPAHNSRLIAAAIPGATYAVLRGARHDFTTDQPTAAAEAIAHFLLRA